MTTLAADALLDRATFDALGGLLGADGLDALLTTFTDELTVRPREVAAHVAAGDPAAARASAHYLKGAAAMLGAQAVAALAGRIELAADDALPALAAELFDASAATRTALAR